MKEEVLQELSTEHASSGNIRGNKMDSKIVA